MMLTKITEYIKENNVKSPLYHTWRELEKDGEKKGEIRILVLEDNKARAEYKCPDCGHHGYLEREWKRPFNVKCDNCGNTIRVPRLKDQIKREKKK